MPSPSRARHFDVPALLCLGGAVLFWGTSFAATKTALASFSPMAVIWWRMTIATIAFLPFWRRVPRPAYRAGDWKLFLLSGLLMPCLYYTFEGYAVANTTSSQAGVISAVVPLLVAAGAWTFLGERVGVRAGAAIAISLAGVAVLSLGGAAQPSAPNPVLGNGLELMAMVAAAGSQLAIKRLSERYNAWLITGAQAAIGTLFFLPGALAGGMRGWAAAPMSAWASLAYLGVFVSLGAFGLYNTALSRMPASRAAISINLIPAVAVLSGWIVLGESLSALQLLACVVIVAAVMFGEGGETREEEPASSADQPLPEEA